MDINSKALAREWWDDLDGDTHEPGDWDGGDLDVDGLDGVPDPDEGDFQLQDPDDAEFTDTIEDVLEDTFAERDERIEAYSREAGHERVRDELTDRGVIESIRERIRELGTRQEDTPRPEGAVLDMRNVTRRLAGDTTVEEYYRRRVPRPETNVAVGVSLDMSGSMRSDELPAKAAVGAFLFAVQQEGQEVIANAWRAPFNTAEMQILTGPYEPFRWEHLDATKPHGRTPTARGIWECAELLDRTRCRNRLLIVVTDGEPSIKSRDDLATDNSVEESAQTVSDLRRRGFTVVGFGIGRVKAEKLAKVFGEDGCRDVALEDLAGALVDVYEEQVGGVERAGATVV